jgi:heterodisulfide reductase subunit C
MGLVNPEFADKLERFGVDSTFECFNCGSCVAVCPLIDGHFPRKMIRFAQLGDEDKILRDAGDLWRCLHCGLCTQTCPRGADPGGLILGLRRFALDRWRRFPNV